MDAAPRLARYSAFISYSHADEPFARRLQRRLETYRLPRRLSRGQIGSAGSQRRLRPLFRDRSALSAAPDLTEEVRLALAESSQLIVVCSPSAAVSAWVGREVGLFRDLHGDGAILTALCRGPVESAFHPALRMAGAGGKTLTPLAADFRRHGDGGRMALLKLVAALAGVRLEDLVQRDAQRRVRQVTAISIAAVVGMLAAGWLAWTAVQGRAEAERERRRSEKVIDFLLTDLRHRLKSVGRLDLLDAVNQGELRYFQGQDLTRLPVGQLQQRAQLLLEIGEDDEKRGQFSAARAEFEEARRTTLSLLREKPNDPKRLFDQAQSEYWNGLIRWRQGDIAGASAGFQAYATLARGLAKIEPGNPDWMLETAYADSGLGMFVLRQAVDTRRARDFFTAALADFQRADRLRPGDHDIQIQIADGWAWLGAADRASRAYDRAEADWMMQRRILLALLARDPRDVETRSDLVSSDLGLGRVETARGRFDRAVEWFQQGRTGLEDLRRNDPDDDYLARKDRALRLFEARAWLMAPPQLRPPLTVVASTIGDCSADRADPRNDELAMLCRIQTARLLAAEGRRADAAKALSALNVGALSGAPKLSERWMIDFADEVEVGINLSRDHDQCNAKNIEN